MSKQAEGRGLPRFRPLDWMMRMNGHQHGHRHAHNTSGPSRPSRHTDIDSHLQRYTHKQHVCLHILTYTKRHDTTRHDTTHPCIHPFIHPSSHVPITPTPTPTRTRTRTSPSSGLSCRQKSRHARHLRHAGRQAGMSGRYAVCGKDFSFSSNQSVATPSLHPSIQAGRQASLVRMDPSLRHVKETKQLACAHCSVCLPGHVMWCALCWFHFSSSGWLVGRCARGCAVQPCCSIGWRTVD